MRYFILILFIGFVSALQKCHCHQITHAYDCHQLGCKWDGIICSEFQCSDRLNESQCLITQNCAWDQSNRCQKFTKCSDYSYPIENKCYLLGNRCQPSTNNDDQGYTICEEKSNLSAQTQQESVNCAKITEEKECKGFEKDGAKCIWNINKYPYTCERIKINQCNDADGFYESVCDLFRCQWNEESKKCNIKQCSDIKMEIGCRNIRNFDGKELTICKWNDKECYKSDASQFGETQCLSETEQTHMWNGQNCQFCYSGILLFPFAMFAIFISF